MFKLSRMPYCNIIFHLNIRQYTKKYYDTKINRIKQLKKEEKQIFGPLLKTSKDKLCRKKFMANTILPSQFNPNDKAEKVINDGELEWSLNVINPQCLRVMRIKSQLHTAEVTKYLDKTCNNVLSNEKSIDTITNADKTHDNKETANIITSIKNASLIFSTKSDVDNWNSPTILSQSSIDNNYYSLPGVTRVLNESMSDKAKLQLENWKKRMILELGEVGFDIYQKELLQNSKIMHSLIENTLKNEPVDVPDHLSLAYNSMSNILKDIKDVRFVESHVVHPTLGYRGVIDCVASYKGNLCVIDWKKSDKLKTLATMYDSPLQISAYIGALNSDKKYPFKVKTGLLVIAYTFGTSPSVFELSSARLEFYWKEWLKRLEKYYTIRNS